MGLIRRNSASVVGRNPRPQSSRVYTTPNSSQTHRTLRTLNELALPRICSLVTSTSPPLRYIRSVRRALHCGYQRDCKERHLDGQSRVRSLNDSLWAVSVGPQKLAPRRSNSKTSMGLGEENSARAFLVGSIAVSGPS